MQNPIPPASWKPSQGVTLGAIVGQFLGQVVVLALDQYLHKAPSPALGIAIGGLITTLCTYFIPDKST
jgi:uncharacterized membrane protein